MSTETSRDYWLLSGALFTFFLTWSFTFSLFPIWLNQTIGLAGESTGIIFIYGPLLTVNLTLGAAVGGIYFGMAFAAGVGTLESYTERVSRIVGFEFGKARLWGSLGWAAATFATGINIRA